MAKRGFALAQKAQRFQLLLPAPRPWVTASPRWRKNRLMARLQLMESLPKPLQPLLRLDPPAVSNTAGPRKRFGPVFFAFVRMRQIEVHQFPAYSTFLLDGNLLNKTARSCQVKQGARANLLPHS